MPRPNQPRSISSERSLGRRIAHEREAREWSYEGTALRMTKAGCAINASAIYKIEKAEPPRRITVDELVAFAEVFKIPVEQLLLPPEIAARLEVRELVVAWESARVRAASAKEHEEAAWSALQNYSAQHPEVTKVIEEALQGWTDYYFDATQQPAALSFWMWRLTGSSEWFERAKAALEGEED